MPIHSIPLIPRNPPEPSSEPPRTWRQRVEDAVLYKPYNPMVLLRLLELEEILRQERLALRTETIEQVEAQILICQAKLTVMNGLSQAREGAREIERARRTRCYADW